MPNELDISRLRPVGEIKKDRKLQRLLLIGAATKLLILLIIALAYFTLPFYWEMRLVNFIYPVEEERGLHWAYKTWDGTHYIYLAEKGYAPGQMSNAYYPLYPLLLRMTGAPFGKTLIAGLLLSGIFSLFGLYFFYMFVKERLDEDTAFTAGLFFLAFPTSFYTSLVYPDGLFIMLAMMLFYYLYRDVTVPALACAFLLPLTRPQGILIAVPLAVFFLTRKKKDMLFTVSRRELPLLGLVAGFAAYLVLMRFWTGSWFAGFNAQEEFVSGNSLFNLFDISGWFQRNFVGIDWELHGYRNSVIDRLFFAGFLAAMYYIYRHLDRTMFTYALVLGLLPTLFGSFMSYTRYLLVVFPIYIILAILLRKKSWALVVPLAVLQAVFLVMHSLFHWVA